MLCIMLSQLLIGLYVYLITLRNELYQFLSYSIIYQLAICCTFVVLIGVVSYYFQAQPLYMPSQQPMFANTAPQQNLFYPPNYAPNPYQANVSVVCMLKLLPLAYRKLITLVFYKCCPKNYRLYRNGNAAIFFSRLKL